MSVAPIQRNSDTIEKLLHGSLNRNKKPFLTDCTTCRDSTPEQSAICLRCCHVFRAACGACVVAGSAATLETHRFPRRGVYEYVRMKVCCKECDKQMQPTFALERQKHVVVITPAAANAMSSENIVARALLPLQLTNLVLSGNLATLESCTILRDNFTGTDLEMIRATFADADWEITITFGYSNVNNRCVYPFAIEFGFGTVWQFDGEVDTARNEDEQMLCAFFRTPANPWFVRIRWNRMKEIFNLLGWRLVEAATSVKEPCAGLLLLWQIRNYMRQAII